MKPRLPVLPLVAMTGLVAALGWRAGQPVEEGEIIDHFAARWTAQGGRRDQCSGVPGMGEVRLIVTCGTQDHRRVWHVDGKGREVTEAPAPRI